MKKKRIYTIGVIFILSLVWFIYSVDGLFDINDEPPKTRGYSINYNFVVKSDSIILTTLKPNSIALIGEVKNNNFAILKGQELVVVDIFIDNHLETDSVWVQLTTENAHFGWISEKELLTKVIPNDPISWVISTFSETHVFITFIVLCLIISAYILRITFKRGANIVHFNDIKSPYPLALALLVASSAVLYGSIQKFFPESWQNFYYHPTLNPFITSPLLSVFLITVWAILIVGLATVDEVRHKLPFGNAMLYLFGLIGVCAVNYIVFSISTLYYVGYLLLVSYYIFAIKRYLYHR